MITLTVIVCVLSVLVVILGFTTFNLMRKNERQEDILAGYLNYLDQLSKTIEISDKKLKEVDQAVKETALDGGESWNAFSKEQKIKFLNILKKMAE